MPVDGCHRDGRVTSGRLRRRRRETDVVVRLHRREEGRRAVGQQQLDQPDRADRRGQLQRRLGEPDRPVAVFGAAVNRCAAVEQELGDAIVAAENGVVEWGPEITSSGVYESRRFVILKKRNLKI